MYNHQQKVHDFFTTYKNHRLMIYCYVMTTKAQKNLIGINVTENETTQSTVVFMSWSTNFVYGDDDDNKKLLWML